MKEKDFVSSRLRSLACGAGLPPERLAACPDDETFGAVVIMDLLEHVPDVSAVLAETRRVTKPGGRLHLHVPCEGDARSLWRWLPGRVRIRGLKRRYGGHVQRFRRTEILTRVEALGFEILRVRNSLHALGNAADVALFLWLALANRSGDTLRTSGDVIASGSPLVRAVDALVYWEAMTLARVPSWSIHVSARKPSTTSRGLSAS